MGSPSIKRRDRKAVSVFSSTFGMTATVPASAVGGSDQRSVAIRCGLTMVRKAPLCHLSAVGRYLGMVPRINR